MAISSSSFETQIADAIATVVKLRIETVVAEETKKAQDAIERRMREELAQITLAIFKEYRVERMGSEIVIRVQNKQETK